MSAHETDGMAEAAGVAATTSQPGESPDSEAVDDDGEKGEEGAPREEELVPVSGRPGVLEASETFDERREAKERALHLRRAACPSG